MVVWLGDAQCRIWQETQEGVYSFHNMSYSSHLRAECQPYLLGSKLESIGHYENETSFTLTVWVHNKGGAIDGVADLPDLVVELGCMQQIKLKLEVSQIEVTCRHAS